MFGGDYFGHFASNEMSPPSNYPLPSPLPTLDDADKYTYNDFTDPVMMINGGGGTSESYGSTSSMASYTTTQRPNYIQRSVSSHSLQSNEFCPTITNLSRVHDQYLDAVDSSGYVRRVYSAGDLNRINAVQQSYQRSESPLSNESSSSIIEGIMTSKACRYSPEEKKEKIEKYRSKRNQRNFNKKIKYACRKTLADSRPRIRGRFARNEDFEKSPDDDHHQHKVDDQWGHLNGGEEFDEDDDNIDWVHFLDALSANLNP